MPDTSIQPKQKKHLGIHWYVGLRMLAIVLITGAAFIHLLVSVENSNTQSQRNLLLAQQMEKQVHNIAEHLIPLYRNLQDLEIHVTNFVAKFELFIIDQEVGQEIFLSELDQIQKNIDIISTDNSIIAEEHLASIKESVGLLVDITEELNEYNSPNMMFQLHNDSKDVFAELKNNISNIRKKLDDKVFKTTNDVSKAMNKAKQNAETQQHVLLNLKQTTLWLMVTLIALTSFIAYSLIKRLNLRLSEVTGFAKSLLAGKYDSSPTSQSNDKIGEMVDAVTSMGHSMASLLQDSQRKTEIAEVAEKRIRKLAFYDSLTELPNRQHFNTMLTEAIFNAKNLDDKIAVFFMDLDNFKKINDIYGHSFGDKLLCAVVNRLKNGLRPTDMIAHSGEKLPMTRISRLGGDEFTFIITNLHDHIQAEHVAQRILHLFSEPYVIEQRKLTVTPSLGIALYPDDGKTVEILVKNSDIAMYQAKANGRNIYKFYNAEVEQKQVDRIQLERDLKEAISLDQLSLLYQPKVDLTSGQIIGAEALLRWNHEERGLVSPAEFIPLAEEGNLIFPIGEWVLKQVCHQLADWKEANADIVPIAINLSSRQLSQSGLLEIINENLQESNLSPSDLHLEITESALMEDAMFAIEILSHLKEVGIDISLDDFGTGYSSLSYLKRFPVNYLKIDRSFIRDLYIDKDDESIILAIIALAKSLGITAIAEGIETEEQLTFLRKHGCDQGQGYYFCKPIPAEQFIQLLNDKAIKATA